MDNLIRTTITLPKNLLRKAKVVSVAEDKNLSELIREALEKRIAKKETKAGEVDLLSLAGIIEPKTAMFKNPMRYINLLRENSDESKNSSS